MLVQASAFASYIDIDHCYAWIKERQDNKGLLSQQMQFAQSHDGAFDFTGATGVAGDGVYCAQTPAGYEVEGDRLVRIDFTKDVVIKNNYDNTCTIGGKPASLSTCNSKGIDILFFTIGDRDDAWYVIRNNSAVKTWSANSGQLQNDLSAAANRIDDQGKVRNLLSAMAGEVSARGEMIYTNQHARGGTLGRLAVVPVAPVVPAGPAVGPTPTPVPTPPPAPKAPVVPADRGTIVVVSATYGEIQNARADYGNATASAASFANGQKSVIYKVDNRHLGLPEANNARFEIKWRCSNDRTVQTRLIQSNAENRKFVISCD
jgi:hypothetical protein